MLDQESSAQPSATDCSTAPILLPRHNSPLGGVILAPRCLSPKSPPAKSLRSRDMSNAYERPIPCQKLMACRPSGWL